jgi:hypothetical protein
MLAQLYEAGSFKGIICLANGLNKTTLRTPRHSLLLQLIRASSGCSPFLKYRPLPVCLHHYMILVHIFIS